MTTILASNVLANGLKTEFADTYTKIRNRQAEGRLGLVMDLGIAATNRKHEFAYFEAAPHMEYWPRGSTIPTDGMGSVKFDAWVHNWGRRVKWHKNDRADDQTQSLFDAARAAGESAALLPERMFFDLIGNATNALPFVPYAPDGVAMFYATDGTGAARFGVTGGNLLTKSGLTLADILNDYYEAIEQFMQFQDGKGQPLLSAETISAGAIVVHAAEDTYAFEQAFQQLRQGLGITATGAISLTAGTAVGATQVSNVVLDSSRNVQLWGTPRLSTGTWYIFLRNSPKKATFLLDRQGLIELSSLEGDNNSDWTRNTGEEYVQWELRQGAGIALPYGAIKIA